MSPLALPLASSSSSPSASASSSVGTEPTKQLASQLAWKTALYLVVVLGTVTIPYPNPDPPSSPYLPSLCPTVVVSVIFGTISLIWNDPWLSSTRRRGAKEEPVRHESTFQLPSGVYNRYVIWPPRAVRLMFVRSPPALFAFSPAP